MAAPIYQKRVYEKTKVPCGYCGKELNITAFKERQSKQHFCNKECYGKYIRKDLAHLICPICGKSFTRKQSQLKNMKDVSNATCSKECCYELRKTLYKGDQNHQYGLTGNKNASWKSDVHHNKYYVLIRVEDHPFRDANNFVLEHRLVAEKYLLDEENSIEINGQLYLKPECIVHHIDFNKRNNDVSNLYVFREESTHTLFHNLYKSGRVKSLEDFLEYYEKTYINKLYNYKWLHRAYIDFDLSINQISKLFNIPYKSVSNEIRRVHLDELKKLDNSKAELLKLIIDDLEKFVDIE